MPRARFPLHLFSIPSALTALVLAVSCDGRWTKDPYAGDTTYQRRLAYLQQRSHAVPTDSLMRMTLRLVNASPSEAAHLARELGCESTRNAVRYGVIPAAAAGDRAYDSLRRAHPEEFARAIEKFNSVPPLETSRSMEDCHVPEIPPAPESLNVQPFPEAVTRQAPKP